MQPRGTGERERRREKTKKIPSWRTTMGWFPPSSVANRAVLRSQTDKRAGRAGRAGLNEGKAGRH
jgi:hypothetical protein